MLKYDLVKDNIYSHKEFKVVVGLGRDKECLPHYLIINKDTDVVEYETDILYAAKAWCHHFSNDSPVQMNMFSDDPSDDEDIVFRDNSTVVPFKPN